MSEKNPLSETRLQKAGREINRIYLVGLLLFIGIMSSITLLGLFLNHLKL